MLKKEKNNFFTYVTKSVFSKDLYRARLFKKMKIRSTKKKKKALEKIEKKT